MAAIKLKHIVDAVDRNHNFELRCNGQPVWDYKDLDGKLVLIHDNNEGGPGYETVTLQEIKQEEFMDLPVMSESLGDTLAEVEIIKSKSKTGPTVLTLNLKFNA